MAEIKFLDIESINGPNTYNERRIHVLNVPALSYSDFFSKYMFTNSPCVIKNVCEEWRAFKDWASSEKINWDFFIENYGDFEAPVADCNKLDFNAQCKSNMRVKEFMEYLKLDEKEHLLYLKDWHLKAMLKKVNSPENFYKVPEYFASDWLNEYAEDKKEDDFQFVYIGAKDTWTPLHADVYSSYSWSVNIFGKKKWILFPPGEEDNLRDSLRNLPILFKSEKFGCIQYFEVIQEKGDAIFVPSGWHHQVFNLQDTISINHNFINACNIDIVWMALQKNLTDVEKEIEEFKDSPDYLNQCQIILKSLFGMDFYSFIDLIAHIAEKRLKQLQGVNFTVFNSYQFGNKHIKFDLQTLYKIFNSIENHILFKNKFLKLSPNHLELKKEISLVIKNS
ncbi:unnamed protein product [Leptosia nina]|uniref:Jumonji domain-containing protein 4 n=1 Tax=Leptosia nina TaxID=320188 RepID=A0AAV1JMF6_9NEOP